jgi:restriction endonuclease S subunit
VVPETLNAQICSTGFSVLRCPSTLNPRFLYYMLISPQVIAQFLSCMRGAHYPALKDNHVKSLRIPDLQLDLQNAIVDTLDALAEHIRAGVAGIEAFAQRLIAEAQLALPALLADVYGQSEAVKAGPVPSISAPAAAT